MVTIEGSKTEKAERDFLYRGISTRHFKRQFNLADYVQVKGATFDNGLLKIELVREIPEAMKPRRIAINGASAGQRPSDRSQGRLIFPLRSAARRSTRGMPLRLMNGGYHAADDRSTTTFSTSTRFFIPARFRTSERCRDVTPPYDGREAGDSGFLGVRCIRNSVLPVPALACRTEDSRYRSTRSSRPCANWMAGLAILRAESPIGCAPPNVPWPPEAGGVT